MSHLKPKVKEQWVTALRSGEYKQGRGLLRSGDKFCCLGVLCDLAVREGVIDEPVTEDYDSSRFAYGDRIACLPPEVGHWAHLGLGDSGNLAYMNDEGASFAEIADHIEKEL